jgi:hypothetical protein
MDEIRPGIMHWTAFHEGIGIDVSSYYLADVATLIDPMTPAEGLDAVDAVRAPELIVLTNRHHLRHSARFVDRFGCTVMCHEAGIHEFEDGPAVEPFRFGDELAPGVTALEVDAICPEETALHIDMAEGILAFADGIVRWDGKLRFVSDRLLGDEPEEVKRGLRRAYTALLDRTFDDLFFAHGLPLLGGGRSALERFLENST